jgi:hypothetical protein
MEKKVDKEKGRVRRTVSLKKDIDKKLDDDRGKKAFSTHLNDVLEKAL